MPRAPAPGPRPPPRLSLRKMVSCALPALCFAGACLLLLTTSAQIRAVTLLDQSTVPHLHDSPLSVVGQLTALTTPARRRRPLLVLQYGKHHESRHDKARASRAMLELYANAWGYDYRADATDYVDGDAEASRLVALKFALGSELLSDNGAEWIFMTDTDAIVSDPTVPLHAMPPEPALFPAPYFLVPQSHLGMATNSMLVKVSARAFHFIEGLVNDLQAEARARGARTGQPSTLDVVDHTTVLAAAMLADGPMSKHVYQVPNAWYHGGELKERSVALYTANNRDATWSPQLLVRSVDDDNFLPYVEEAASVLRQRMKGGKVIEDLEWARATEEVCREFWAQSEARRPISADM